MRKKLVRSLLALSISAAALSATAQPAIPREYVETPGFSLGMNVGLADLWGDVGTQGPIDHYINGTYWDRPCFMGGLFIRYTPHPVWSARLAVNYGTLYATDQWNYDKAKKAKSIDEDAFQRYLRNQDIRANVWEGTLMLELAPLRFNSESRAANKRLQPFLMAGVGAFHFQPQSSLPDLATGKSKWIDVHHLHLEGDGVTYDEATPGFARKTNLWQVCVPVGAGLRWDLNEDMSLGIEYLYRFTTTDRLDNVSDEFASKEYFDAKLTPENAELAKRMYDKSYVIEPSIERKPWTKRGNKEVLDGYSTISISFIYKLKDNKIPWWN
jgi:opacity protein-like surface antigen